MFLRIVFLSLIYFSLLAEVSAQSRALVHGHAHNDYAKAREPLVAAVQLGFTSIEIDVFPTQKGLKVAHIGLEVPFSKGLEELYFKPLEELLKQQGGQLFDNPQQQLILMIDIKKDAKKSYQLLKKICKKYQHLISTYEPKTKIRVQRKVDIILSGHKPIVALNKDTLWYMQIDGGLDKIGADRQLFPRVSANYNQVLQWKGKGVIPIQQKEKIEALVKAAHANGQKLRLWAMPNNRKVWQTLLELGVDWMNVDKIENFKDFYETYQSK